MIAFFRKICLLLNFLRCKILSFFTTEDKKYHYVEKSGFLLKKTLLPPMKINGRPGNKIHVDKNNNAGVNIAIYGSGNEIRIEEIISTLRNIDIVIHGNNNKIVIRSIYAEGEVKITCEGNNGLISTGLIGVGQKLMIRNGYEQTEGAKVVIGNNVSIESLEISNYHSGATVQIDDDCMISHNVSLLNTDSHPIISKEERECINKLKPDDGIHIGKHVWLGMNCTVLKNVSVPDNTIVGYGAVVSKSFEEEYTAIAGNPAKVVKENIVFEKSQEGFFS